MSTLQSHALINCRQQAFALRTRLWAQRRYYAKYRALRPWYRVFRGVCSALPCTIVRGTHHARHGLYRNATVCLFRDRRMWCSTRAHKSAEGCRWGCGKRQDSGGHTWFALAWALLPIWNTSCKRQCRTDARGNIQRLPARADSSWVPTANWCHWRLPAEEARRQVSWREVCCWLQGGITAKRAVLVQVFSDFFYHWSRNWEGALSLEAGWLASNPRFLLVPQLTISCTPKQHASFRQGALWDDLGVGWASRSPWHCLPQRNSSIYLAACWIQNTGRCSLRLHANPWLVSGLNLNELPGFGSGVTFSFPRLYPHCTVALPHTPQWAHGR